MHVYEIRPRKDKRGFDLICPTRCHLAGSGTSKFRNAIGYAEFRSRSCNVVIRVYDDAGNVIETHEHAGEFKDP
jgi:hypothetical protein